MDYDFRCERENRWLLHAEVCQAKPKPRKKKKKMADDTSLWE